jgi:magnesium and cobalt transporter
MSDTGNASSQALGGLDLEQSDDPPEGQSRGFFSRIMGALSPAESDSAEAQDRSPMTIVMPGMSNLRRMRVEDVMIPKADIVAVPVTIGMDDLVTVFRESGMTRIPVFDGTLDTPVGMVNLKDFALRHGFTGGDASFDLRATLRPLLYVPPSMPLVVLLQKMQADRLHMALVIDEYGGTDGLVTIEDLLETVVGDIDDEHDEAEASNFTPEKAGVWLAQAKTPLEEFEAEIGMNLTAHDAIDEEEVDTLGGLVFMLAGHVPARGEIIRHPDGPEFEVVDADPRRIKRLRVRLTPAAPAE